MLNRLQRYILRSLTLSTVYATAGLTITIWLSQSLKLIELVVEAGAPLRLFVWLLLLTVPTFLGVVLPISLVGAVLFTYHRLGADSELVVMRSAGLGPWGLARPALLLSGLVMFIVFALNVYITPAAHRELVRMEYAIRDDHSQLLLREGVFNEVGRKLSVYVRERGMGGELKSVVIHDARTQGKPVTVIGERAMMVYGPSGARFVVFNGNRQEFNRETATLSQLYFERYDVDLSFVGEGGGERYPDARERTMWELLHPETLQIRSGDPKAVQQLIAEFHHRLASPMLTPAYVLIGLACLLSGEFNRRGMSGRITVAAGLVVVLQAASLGGTSLAAKAPGFIPMLYLLPLLIMPPAAWVLSGGRWKPRAAASDPAPDAATGPA
jgi:lipopolysaccharide export system permease protein